MSSKIKNFFERLKRKERDKKKFMFTTRNLGQQTPNGERMADGQLRSFMGTNSVQAYAGTISQGSSTQNLSQYFYTTEEAVRVTAPENKTPEAVKDERKAVEPKAVFEELKKVTPEVSFDKLDEKIASVEERIKVLSEHLDEAHLKDEHMALFYLKNRRAYLKTRGKNPIDWATTTREAIDQLCKCYKLKVVAIKQYYTLIPKDGIKEMERYTKAYKAITGDNPIIELIIKDADVKTVEGQKQKKKDRDPIMVANSPFGNALFVLGAWDDEVEIVDEIIYGLK